MFPMALMQLGMLRFSPRLRSQWMTDSIVRLWVLVVFVMLCSKSRLAAETLCATTIKNNVWIRKAGRENMAEMRERET